LRAQCRPLQIKPHLRALRVGQAEQIAAQVARRIKAKVGAVHRISLEQKKNIKVAFDKLVANRASPNVAAEAEQRPNSQNPL
jgi:hypothetical protein